MRRCLPHLNPWAAHVTGKRSVVEMYDQLARKGVIRPDARQRLMAEACSPLLSAAREEARRRAKASTLVPLSSQVMDGDYGAAENSFSRGAWRGGAGVLHAATTSTISLLRKLFPALGSRALHTVFPESLGVAGKRGLYLYGGVGIGKTMILDLFELCDVGLPKQRAHLHSFMTDISDRLVKREIQLRHRRQAAKGSKTEMAALASIRPIDLVVSDVLRETPVLCFDEFQTFDVAHAALLSAFFTASFAHGMFLITTSNRPPEELCAISSTFTQFLPRLKRYCAMVDGGPIRDYRQRPREEHCHSKVFLSPNNKQTAKRLLRRVEEGIQARMTRPTVVGVSASDATVAAREPPTWVTEDTLWHHGRCLVIPYSCSGVAVFDFPDICGGQRQDLASADFQLLAKNFHTVIVYNVPQIGTANRNAAHQFIVLVDELYQHNVKLLFTSQVPWEALLDTANDRGRQATIESGAEAVESDYYSEGEDDRSGFQAFYSFRNEEELISFTRIRSRLAEMGCSSYLTREHSGFLTGDFDFAALVADEDGDEDM